MTHARNRDYYIRVTQEQAPSTHDRASEQTLIYKGSQPTLGCAPQTNSQAYGHEGLLTNRDFSEIDLKFLHMRFRKSSMHVFILDTCWRDPRDKVLSEE